MPETLDLHKVRLVRHLPGAGYCWLSAPGSSALSVLFLYTGRETPAFADVIRDGPALVWLADQAGRRIDQAMAARKHGGVLITCHGGRGVRDAVTEALHNAGLAELNAAEAPLFGHRTRFERALVALLPEVRGHAAVGMVLEALSQCPALERALSAPGDLGALLDAGAGARFLVSPPRVQLWGPVNAGKSTLLNALCGRSLAVTGGEPGLTRDVIEGRFQHKGFEIRLFDAPGVWAEGEGVDRAAQELAARWREKADLTLELVPPGASAALDDAWALHSRADELDARPPNAVSVRDGSSLNALKDRLIDHFFAPLQELSPERRFALEPALRRDLRDVSEGRQDASDVRERWLSLLPS